MTVGDMVRSRPPPRRDSAAPAAARLGHVVLDAGTAVGQARALIREFHVSLGAVGELIDDVVLVTSELVTNAVLHGSPPVGLLARAGSRWLRVEVHDHSSAMPVGKMPTTTSTVEDWKSWPPSPFVGALDRPPLARWSGPRSTGTPGLDLTEASTTREH